MKCPVCDSDMSSLFCSCGYDASRDYAVYPTFGPVGRAEPASGLRARRAPKDALRCAQCGGSDFTIRIPDNTRRCSKCGWSPDPKPHIECACGGRYFTVRASDGALMCPLCSRDILLDDLIARVRPAPKPAPAPHNAPVKSAPVITAIAAGASHTVALYSDGTVRAVGGNNLHQCDVQGWTNVVAIAARGAMTVGLCADGTVLSTGTDRFDQHCVANWSNIKAIATGNGHTVGLRRDGTVIAVGNDRRN